MQQQHLPLCGNDRKIEKISIHFVKILEMNFKNLIGVDKMLQFFIGFILGAIISLFLYACIIAGAEYDKKLYGEEARRE